LEEQTQEEDQMQPAEKKDMVMHDGSQMGIGLAATVESELRQLRIGHREAVDSRSSDAILQFYAPDLITVAPGKPILRGREWIREACDELFRDFDFHEDFDFVDIRIMGDRIAASYEYSQQMTPLTGGESVIQTGKGIFILKRSEAGRWQIEWNAYTTDPAPGQV
jgi:uncharacterized protein (TIGR02246 family)